jgi:uracil-DNA glycosylase
VVIIGQDPYFQTVHVDGKVVPRAVGLSFSVRRGDEIPISLKNIYRVLSSTVEGFQTPNHGDLRAWATQGVLLANTSLTVRPDEPNSHEGIWLDFMKKVFKGIARVNPRCIYLLWGREAQRLRPLLGEKSIFLETSHPSGKSASRGFLDCNHFNLANKYLIEQGNKPINWNL